MDLQQVFNSVIDQEDVVVLYGIDGQIDRVIPMESDERPSEILLPIAPHPAHGGLAPLTARYRQEGKNTYVRYD